MAPTAEELVIWAKLYGQAAVVRGLGSIRAANEKMRSSMAAANREFDKGKKKAGGFRQSLTIMRKSIVGLTAASSAFVVVGLGKSALDFEDSMARVRATLTGNKGFNDAMFKKLTDATMHWAEVSRFSSDEVADGLFKIVSNGFNAQQALEALGGTTDLAGASGFTMAEAADIQTSTLNQFGLSAKKASYVADILVQAVNSGSAELDNLRDSLKYIGPVASTFGSDLKPVVALLEVMAQGGFKGAFSGRALRTGFVRLVKPTKDVRKGLRLMGLSLKDLQNKDGLLPLPQLLDKLRIAYRKMGKGAEGKEALGRVFGTEAIGQWIYAIEHSGKPLDKMIAQLDKSKGKARQFSKIMMNTVRGAIEQFTNSITNLVTKLLMKYSPQIQSFFNKMANGVSQLGMSGSPLRKRLQPVFDIIGDLFRIGGAIAEGVAPALAVAFGLVLKAAELLAPAFKWIADNGELVKAVVLPLISAWLTYRTLMAGHNGIIGLAGLLGKAWGTMNRIMKANPLIFWLSVAAAVVIFFIKLYKGNETFRHAVQRTGEIFKAVGEWIINAAQNVWDFLKTYWPLLAGILGGPFVLAVGVIMHFWSSIKNGATTAYDWVKDKFNMIVTFFQGLPARLGQAGKEMGKAIVNGMIDMINAGIASINSALSFSVKVGVGPVSKTFHVNPPDIPSIPHLATGGTATKAGAAIVGENGAEAVSLPAGARVTPLRAPSSLPLSNLSTAGAQGGDIRVPVYLDGRVIAETVHRRVEQRKARR